MEQLNLPLMDQLRAINLKGNNFNHEARSLQLRRKSAYIEFIKEILEESNTILIFTLTFIDRYKVSLEQAEKDARHFKNMLDKDVFGKSNNRWKNRHPACLVVEGNDYKDDGVRTHIHGIIGFNNDSVLASKRLVRKHWSKIRKSGFITEIKEWDGRDQWINYLLKKKTKDVPYNDAIAVLDRSRK